MRVVELPLEATEDREWLVPSTLKSPKRRNESIGTRNTGRCKPQHTLCR